MTFTIQSSLILAKERELGKMRLVHYQKFVYKKVNILCLGYSNENQHHFRAFTMDSTQCYPIVSFQQPCEADIHFAEEKTEV